jgi:hypothetical protein
MLVGAPRSRHYLSVFGVWISNRGTGENVCMWEEMMSGRRVRSGVKRKYRGGGLNGRDGTGEEAWVRAAASGKGTKGDKLCAVGEGMPGRC